MQTGGSKNVDNWSKKVADIDALSAKLDPMKFAKFASYYPDDVKCDRFTSNRIRSTWLMVRSRYAPNEKRMIKVNYCTVGAKAIRNGGAGRKSQVDNVTNYFIIYRIILIQVHVHRSLVIILVIN